MYRSLLSIKVTVLVMAMLIAFGLQTSKSHAAGSDTLIVAGGCFWCVESDFEQVSGVIEVVSGYTGGHLENPTYKQVTRGGTGHFEAVEIQFDPDKVSLDTLLHAFLRSVDVTDAGGQFCDRGDSYRTAIFARPDQRDQALAAIKKAQSDLGQIVVTPVLDKQTFYKAEDYHQDYYKGTSMILTRFGPKRQSEAYKRYRDACGRDQRVHEIWGAQAAFEKH